MTVSAFFDEAARFRADARARLCEDGSYGRYLAGRLLLGLLFGCCVLMLVAVQSFCESAVRQAIPPDAWQMLVRTFTQDPAEVTPEMLMDVSDTILRVPLSVFVLSGAAVGTVLFVLTYILGFAGWSGRAMAIACVRRGLKVSHAFSGWGHGWRMSWLLGLEGLYVFFWSCLLIVPGICKFFSYALAPYLLVDHPTWSASACLSESERLMAGHKGRLFVLVVSFFGWYLLVILTQLLSPLFGQGASFLLTPYPETAFALFYEARLDEEPALVPVLQPANPDSAAEPVAEAPLGAQEDDVNKDEEKKA